MYLLHYRFRVREYRSASSFESSIVSVDDSKDKDYPTDKSDEDDESTAQPSVQRTLTEICGGEAKHRIKMIINYEHCIQYRFCCIR